MEDNLKLFNEVADVPKDAQKQIKGGRLRGMTDINPMWRIRTLTEKFGPVGIGWYYTIKKQWIEEGANGEKCGFMNIDLFYKYNGEWSKPVEGTGGSSFIAKETQGLYTSDEVFKMALTDALSVACKAIGMGANVYWNSSTKYTQQQLDEQGKPTQQQKKQQQKAAPQKQVEIVLSPQNGANVNNAIKYVGETLNLPNKEVIRKIEQFMHKPIKQLTDNDMDGVMAFLNELTKAAV